MSFLDGIEYPDDQQFTREQLAVYCYFYNNSLLISTDLHFRQQQDNTLI